MKRSEFLKRLGLGLGAAVAAPSLLKGDGYNDYINRFKNQESVKFSGNIKRELINENLTFEVTKYDGSVVSVNNVRMQIKGKGEYEMNLTEGRGITINGNKINADINIPCGEYDYEMTMNNDIISKGKYKV